jgi:ketosteroid isomerase-like protein
MRPVLTFLVAFAVSCGLPSPPPASRPAAAPDTSAVRREIERWYDDNARAFRAGDVEAIMALRTEDFHTVAPDGTVQDRAAMESRTIAFLNGIDRWISMDLDIDGLEVSGDMAEAVMRQHLVRMALRPDGLVHHVETWATQNETFRRTPEGWKLYRVDGVRDQRRLVDGKPDG